MKLIRFSSSAKPLLAIVILALISSISYATVACTESRSNAHYPAWNSFTCDVAWGTIPGGAQGQVCIIDYPENPQDPCLGNYYREPVDCQCVGANGDDCWKTADNAVPANSTIRRYRCDDLMWLAGNPPKRQCRCLHENTGNTQPVDYKGCIDCPN